jgi:hypothetical protein
MERANSRSRSGCARSPGCTNAARSRNPVAVARLPAELARPPSRGIGASSRELHNDLQPKLEGRRRVQREPHRHQTPALVRGEHMPAKQTARRPSSRRQASRTPAKRLVALAGGASKRRSRAKRKPGFRASVGRGFGDLSSGLRRELSRGAGKKRLAALLTTAAGALAASAAFIRRRGRRPEPPAVKPTPETTAATTPQPGGGGQPAGDTASPPTTPPHIEGPS